MNARVSVIKTFGPDDEDTVEHVILKTCASRGCESPAPYHEKYCDKCRQHFSGEYIGILDALRGWVKL